MLQNLFPSEHLRALHWEFSRALQAYGRIAEASRRELRILRVFQGSIVRTFLTKELYWSLIKGYSSRCTRRRIARIPYEVVIPPPSL